MYRKYVTVGSIFIIGLKYVWETKKVKSEKTEVYLKCGKKTLIFNFKNMSGNTKEKIK